jgi:hypothetical protein
MNLYDRVYALTATVGAGSMVMGAAKATEYRSFSVVTNGHIVPYVIRDGTAWELGFGTWTSGTNTLTRTLRRSSTGSLLVLTGGAEVYIAPHSDDLLAALTALTSANNLSDVASPSAAGANIRPVESFVIAAGDETTAITASAGKVKWRAPYAFTITAVRASLSTAQASGSIFTVDINEGVTSILSTKLTIDNTEKTSTTAVTPPVISDASIADDAELSIDVDQIGDGTAAGLKVTIIGNRT